MSILNSFSPNTPISSTNVNANFSDIGSEITGSLPRDGQAAMTGQLKASNGTASLPGIAFGSDTDTGFFRKSGNVIGISAGGVEVASISASGLLDALGIVVAGIPTGCIMNFGAVTAPSGWVRLNARTIGTVASAATERANADTENLYSFLWTNYSDTVCPVTGGRGASAAADFAANKPIALPDVRGRSLFGLDDMGSTAAGRLAGATIDETTNGAAGGADTVTIAQANLPAYTLPNTLSVTNGGTVVTALNKSVNSVDGGSDTANVLDFTGTTVSTAALSVGGGVTSGGSGTALSNMPPAFLTTFIIKL